MGEQETIIRVENLGKQYVIVHGQAKRCETFRDAVMNGLRSLGRRIRRPWGRAEGRETREKFWALKEVSFEVKRGEVVGIIGRNGAGKSTLLKVLSQITEPTTGMVILDGRVASLLEVGTGFHPELTGGENIYLNGAILGMTRAEIRRKFDEIVAFAEVEHFIDTPVKHYSSGMYMRLAFAVAAHLEPEILIIDEILAVGDVDFQRKCIGSMGSMATSGRTILIVSHNLALIESLCHKAILLQQGRVASSGPVKEVIANHLVRTGVDEQTDLLSWPRSQHTPIARFSRFELVDEEGRKRQEFKIGEGFTVRLEIVATHPIMQPWIGIRIFTAYEQLLSHVANREAGFPLSELRGKCTICCSIRGLNLLPGRYYIDLVLADVKQTVHDSITRVGLFDIRASDVFSTGMPLSAAHGIVCFRSEWRMSCG